MYSAYILSYLSVPVQIHQIVKTLPLCTGKGINTYKFQYFWIILKTEVCVYIYIYAHIIFLEGYINVPWYIYNKYIIYTIIYIT